MMCLVRRISIESCPGKCGRRLAALILFPSTPQAHSRPSPRQLSPTVALDDALGQPLDDAIEAEAFVKRTATVLAGTWSPGSPRPPGHSGPPPHSLSVLTRPAHQTGVREALGALPGGGTASERTWLARPKHSFFGPTLGALSVA